MRVRLLLPVLGLLAAAPPAQTDAAHLIPGDSVLVVEADGASAFRAAFAETRVGRMLAGQRMAGFLAPLRLGLQMGLQRAAQQTSGDVRGVYEQLEEYGGRIRFALTVDLDAIDRAEPSMPEIGMVWVLAPDGATDLPGLVAACNEIVEDTAPDARRGSLSDVEVDAVSYRAFVQEDGAGFTLPRMVGDSLVVMAGSPLERAVSRFAAAREHEAFELPAHLATSQLAVHVDGRTLVTALEKWLTLRADSTGDEEAAMLPTLFELFGLRSLGDISLSLRAVEEHVAVDLGVRLAGGKRGLFGIYAPEHPGRPAMLELVPRQADSWGVQGFRVDVLYDLARDFMDAMQDRIGMGMDDVERNFAEETGMRLREDLLDHLGSNLLYVFDTEYFRTTLRDDGPDGVCYAFALRRPAAFAATLEKLLRDRGLYEMFETESYRQHRIHTMKMDAELSWAVSARALVVGVGPGGARHLRAILDAEDQVAAGEPVGEFRPEVEARLGLGPRGWDHAASFRIQAITAALLEHAAEQGEMSDVGQRIGQSVLGMLADFGLEDVVFAGRFDDTGMTLRLVW